MDPKVKPPTRIVVSGGPKVEPHLHMAHPAPVRGKRFWAKLIVDAVAAVVILWAFVSLFFLMGAGQ